MASIVILDRIEPGEPEPDYCIHGRATCMGGCDEWVWLGSESVQLVTSGELLPVCQPCANALVPADRAPLRRVDDHRRADGPH